VPEELSLPIKSDADIVVARQKGRALATDLGFSTTDATLIATAISELARNIVSYARAGQIALKAVMRGSTRGIMVTATDQGPGISNVSQAMQDGFSTSGSLGLGLPGVRRLADEFQIDSKAWEGTKVVFKKWNV